ncbi:MAG: cupin domain-containing protein [Pseudomonadota bacterium]
MPRPDEHYFKEGCYIEEWHNTDGDQDCSVAHVRVEPQTQTKLHALKGTTERYVILQGKGRVQVGDRKWEVAEGDVVVIPADCSQSISNNESDDLCFLAICSPRFKEENYLELATD